MKKGLTLMESLVIITLFIILASIVIFQLNPKDQINKAKDSKRKKELTILKKILEDWYNDKNCYPKPKEICYDSQPNLPTCHICGDKPSSPNFQPYLNKLPCDPDSLSNRNYLYQVDNLSCPKTYQIYGKLNYDKDPIIEEIGCQYGCAPRITEQEFESLCQSNQYNYGISSSNTNLESCNSILLCSNFNPIYILSSGICNLCGSYNECISSQYSDKTFYKDYQCQKTCIKN